MTIKELINYDPYCVDTELINNNYNESTKTSFEIFKTEISFYDEENSTCIFYNIVHEIVTTTTKLVEKIIDCKVTGFYGKNQKDLPQNIVNQALNHKQFVFKQYC